MTLSVPALSQDSSPLCAHPTERCPAHRGPLGTGSKRVACVMRTRKGERAHIFVEGGGGTALFPTSEHKLRGQ